MKVEGRARMTSTAGSWYGLLAILREARQTDAQQRGMRPVYCPNDGTLLITHPVTGRLHCTWDGYDPTGQDHP